MNPTVARARHGHPGLFWFAVVMAALTVVTAVLAVVDQRVVLGEPVWFKPLRFAVSFTLYAGTLAWMLARLPGRGMRATGWVLVVTSAIEMAIIVGQAARGTRSHFNYEDMFSTRLLGIMAATIVVLYLATIAVALRFLRERRTGPDATATAVRLGLVVGVAGLTVGVVMAALGAHAVGVPDGGPGLPFTGWSTVGGDLRIGHFLGMHALQLLPLLAAGLAGTPRLDERGRADVVRVAAAGYGGLVLLVTWQALRAQPLLAPDALTLAALAVVVAGTGAALGAVLRAAARRTSRRPAVPVAA
ncbi:hypothetical protein BJF78_17130 [Pseudonocardia sp. CNS-139]|nr:hypothetical protein BJF78_17130 [Pseudonocardia sp. CNS-139]